MVRKLSLAIALALGVSPFAVNGLGLGEIKSKSGLNQNFMADIELLSIGNEEIVDIRAFLASEEIFRKAGVNRPFFLSQLKFKPVRLPDGRGVIRVTSAEPVREPFLNFLIELNWPKGRLYREYTVLLDPPATLQRRVPPPVQAATTGATAGTAGREPRPREDLAGSDGGFGEYGPTQRNDTLWKIALQVRHSGTTVEQMMMAMFRANPQAFIDRNINNLKVGEILRVPEREEVLAMSAGEARLAFREQVENWRAERAAPSMSEPAQDAVTAGSEPPGQIAREEAAAPPPEPAAVPEVELKIARMQTAEEGEKQAADSVDQTGGSASLREDLFAARELRESAIEESRELKERVESLASQLEDLQRLLVLKDEQLAKLQLALADRSDSAAAMPGEVTAAAPEPDTIPAPMEPATIPAPAEPASTAAPPEAAAETAPEPAVAPMEEPTLGSAAEKAAEARFEIPRFEGAMPVEEDPAGPGEEMLPVMPEAVAPAATSPAADAVPVESEESVTTGPIDQKAATAPAERAAETETTAPPAAQPGPEPEAGFMEKLTGHPLLKKITGDPVMLAVGGGLVAVVLALVWLLTGRRRREDEEFQESILADTAGEREEAELIEPAEAGVQEPGTTEANSFVNTSAADDKAAPPDETGEVDPIAEADVYIAYGRYRQAEELVRHGLERNPEDQELLLKLFEILYEMKNAAAFTALAEKAEKDGLRETDPGAWRSVAAMGAKLVPGNSLFVGGPDAGGSPAGESPIKPSETGEPDLEDLAASLDLDEESTGAPARPGGAAAGLDQQPGQKEEPESRDAESLDLDFPGASPEAPVVAEGPAPEPEPTETPQEDEFNLTKLAQELVGEGADEEAGVAGRDNKVLDFPSLDSEKETDPTGEPGLSVQDIENIELDTEEVERLELPDFDELPDEPLDDLTLDVDDSSDEVNTKLDLARAYLEMGDQEGARSILQEVMNEGSEQQQQAAQKMLGGFS